MLRVFFFFTAAVETRASAARFEIATQLGTTEVPFSGDRDRKM